ncbi:glycosyltransferase [Fodinisporobacter ferrooxydans]|uniref:Glycosyltransferase n=1 Tax=Fodinisporobacter ferrooxydans TaxID=2901836 RepID=A0ABY4CMG8_9BACL|nr:glycosyltransferase [Alicyclobacillaceae bacterium MYW30-H2]
MSQYRKPNILILYGNYGSGHKRAAEAVAASIQSEMPDATIFVEDFLGQAFPVGDWVLRNLYLQTFSWAKPVYGWLYYKTKEWPADHALFQSISYLGVWKLERFLRDIQPDIIISTFPALTGMLALIKERGNVFFNLWCVVTDYTVHSQWLYKSVDQYFVPTDTVRVQMIQAGIDAHSIVSTGIPIFPTFYQKQDRNRLLKKWNLSPNRPVVLMSAGAFGVTNFADVSQQLAQTCPQSQFVVICGRNHKLYKQLLTISQFGIGNLHPLPFVQEVDELLQVADLFVTKPGGLSVSEAIACSVPMILCRSTPGQESENANYLVASGAARFVDDNAELLHAISSLTRGTSELARMKLNIQSIRHPISPAERIASITKKTFETDQLPYAKELYLQPHMVGEVL